MTTIEWTRGDDGAMGKTWNPVRGCARVSPGCEHCYAERVAHRFSGRGGKYEGLTVLGKKGPRWSGVARFVSEKLAEPLSWRKPRRVFVNSMSDLFHEDVTNEQIAAVFGVMAACPQHTFQILTKRPERMKAWFGWIAQWGQHVPEGDGCVRICAGQMDAHTERRFHMEYPRWPLPNVWLGVSCEDQQRAKERIPLLLQCPAAVRFVSAEPLLGPLDLRPYLSKLDCLCCPRCGFRTNQKTSHCPNDGIEIGSDVRLDWVIVGGESGHGARECHVDWIRSIVQQCADADVACFVKQEGASNACVHNRKGGHFDCFHGGNKVREFPYGS
jgi:protein gp37